LFLLNLKKEEEEEAESQATSNTIIIGVMIAPSVFFNMCYYSNKHTILVIENPVLD